MFNKRLPFKIKIKNGDEDGKKVLRVFKDTCPNQQCHLLMCLVDDRNADDHLITGAIT